MESAPIPDQKNVSADSGVYHKKCFQEEEAVSKLNRFYYTDENG